MLLLSCSDICIMHPSYIPVKKIDCSTGTEVCINCDRAIFMSWQDYHCPCCNKSLRTKPQYYGENSKAKKEATLRRH